MSSRALHLNAYRFFLELSVEKHSLTVTMVSLLLVIVRIYIKCASIYHEGFPEFIHLCAHKWAIWQNTWCFWWLPNLSICYPRKVFVAIYVIVVGTFKTKLTWIMKTLLWFYTSLLEKKKKKDYQMLLMISIS